MGMKRGLPLSSDDLRKIADTIDELALLLINDDSGYTENVNLINRIELFDPWDEEKPNIGYAILHADGWIGFEFNKKAAE